MVAHRLLLDRQAPPDLPVRKPFGEKDEDLALASGKGGEGGVFSPDADHAQKVNSYRTSRASVADTVTYFD